MCWTNRFKKLLLSLKMILNLTITNYIFLCFLLKFCESYCLTIKSSRFLVILLGTSVQLWRPCKRKWQYHHDFEWWTRGLDMARSYYSLYAYEIQHPFLLILTIFMILKKNDTIKCKKYIFVIKFNNINKFVSTYL